MLDVVVLLEQEKASLGFQFHPFFAPLAFVWPSFFLQNDGHCFSSSRLARYGFAQFINRPHQPCYPCQVTLTLATTK